MSKRRSTSEDGMDEGMDAESDIELRPLSTVDIDDSGDGVLKAQPSASRVGVFLQYIKGRAKSVYVRLRACFSSLDHSKRNILICIFVLSSFVAVSFLTGGSKHKDYITVWNGDPVMMPIKPSVIRFDGSPHYYKLPHGKLKGLLIVLSNCGDLRKRIKAMDFFHFPENRLIAYEALQNGLAVLSVTPRYDRLKNIHLGHDCWNTPGKEIDLPNVIQTFEQELRLKKNLPRIALGEGRGAHYLFRDGMIRSLGVSAAASYISPAGYENVQQDGVPTVFLHMPKDTETAAAVRKASQQLGNATIPTKVLEVQPHPFTIAVCKNRIYEYKDRCQALFERIEQNKKTLLDENYNVLEEFNEENWETVLGHTSYEDRVVQEISVAYGYHEVSAEYRSEVMRFLLEHAKVNKN